MHNISLLGATFLARWRELHASKENPAAKNTRGFSPIWRAVLFAVCLLAKLIDNLKFSGKQKSDL